MVIDMYKITIKVDTRDMMDNVKKELELCMNDFTIDMKNDAVQKVYDRKPSELSDRTDELRSTTVASHEWQGTQLIGKVETDVKYAEYLEHGTGEFSDEHRGGARTHYKGKIDKLVGKPYKVLLKRKEKIQTSTGTIWISGEVEREHTGWVWIKGQQGIHFMKSTCDEYRDKVKEYFTIG